MGSFTKNGTQEDFVEGYWSKSNDEMKKNTMKWYLTHYYAGSEEYFKSLQGKSTKTEFRNFLFKISFSSVCK